MTTSDGEAARTAPCAVCGDERPVGRVIPVFTAIRSATTVKTGFKQFTTTTTTGMVKELHRTVCDRCVAVEKRNRWILVAVVALGVAVGFPLLAAADVAGGWLVALGFGVLAAAAGIDQTFIDLQQRTKRATIGAPAIALFRSNTPGPEVIGFTASEYKAFVKQNK